jgi:hypothetical protein
MRLFGFAVEEAQFFAGHLRVPGGLPAERAAFELAMPAALAESVRLVASSPLLEHVNHTWGRETVRLHLSKSLAMSAGGPASIYGYALRVQSARGLSGSQAHETVLLMEQPAVFAPSCLDRMAPELRIITYAATAALVASKLQLFRQGIRGSLRRVKGLWSRMANATQLSALQRRASARPNLLLLQEDDIGLDRSYRGQPHWLFPDDPQTSYETFILSSARTARVRHDQVALDDANIRVLSDAEVLALSSAAAEPIATTLRQSARTCFVAGWRSRSAPETHALAMLARLLLTASELAGACHQLRIRTFMTGENYLLAGDAMALIGDALDVHTLSYQYSNLAILSPVMLTTADVMLTFAPAYHAHWVHETIWPRAFVDVGYTFDSSFALVEPRARAARDRLRAAGATFVIAYFDENVIRSKYALTGVDDHCDELRLLLNMVLADPSVSLVTKTQFQQNSPGRLAELAPLVAAATATGRYLELVRGVHRNNVLPAEAALTADLTIGHSVGGTAPLEAALAGARTILLNPYSMRDANHAVYERADILIATLEEAVQAIAAFRSGRRAGLGDWTSVIAHFDRFRDGRAGRRIRAALDCLMADAQSKTGAVDFSDRVRKAVQLAS